VQIAWTVLLVGFCVRVDVDCRVRQICQHSRLERFNAGQWDFVLLTPRSVKDGKCNMHGPSHL
jgi:hypothetical protein